jgi:hypothetical protein
VLTLAVGVVVFDWLMDRVAVLGWRGTGYEKGERKGLPGLAMHYIFAPHFLRFESSLHTERDRAAGFTNTSPSCVG